MTVESLFAVFQELVNPKTTKNLQVIFHFIFSDVAKENYTLEINHGKCSYSAKIPSKFNIQIKMKFSDFLSIVYRKKSLPTVFLAGKIRYRGNPLHIMRFRHYFSGNYRTYKMPNGLYANAETKKDTKQRPVYKKIMLVQGSPRGKRGATEYYASLMEEGFRNSGAVCDKIHLYQKKIGSCTGCYHCWSKTNGICVQKDDMTGILKGFPDYDLVVFAIPLYIDGVPGILKNFMDRLLPLLHPYIFLKNGRCRHPSRNRRMPDLFLMSVCGFYEIKNFMPLRQHMRAFCGNFHMNYAGDMFRAQGQASIMDFPMIRFDEVSAAFRRAGEELAIRGAVKAGTRVKAQADLFERKHYLTFTKDWIRNKISN